MNWENALSSVSPVAAALPSVGVDERETHPDVTHA